MKVVNIVAILFTIVTIASCQKYVHHPDFEAVVVNTPVVTFNGDEASFSIPLDGENVEFELKEVNIRSESHKAVTIDAKSGVQEIDAGDSCLFRGSIAGQEQSLAVFSLCSGNVNGHFFYHGQAMEVDQISEDLIEVYSRTKDATTGKMAVNSGKPKPLPYAHNQKTRSPEKRTSFPEGNIDIVIVNDYSRCEQFGFDATAIIADSQAIVTSAAPLFDTADFKLTLTVIGQILLFDENSVFDYDVDSNGEVDSEELWQSVEDWLDDDKNELKAIFGEKYDTVSLFTARDFEGNVIGRSEIDEICDQKRGASVDSMTGSLSIDRIILAHELGHLLSLEHEDDRFDLIMNDEIRFISPGDGWTATDIEDLKDAADKSCLSKDGNVVSTFCGNGIVEAGEECDPGFPGIDSCCDSNCQLKSACTCANSDPCCENGQYKSSTTVCRASRGPCDTAEYCTGSSSSCPADSGSSDGSSCSVNGPYTNGLSGQCLGFVCYSPDLVCEDIAKSVEDAGLTTNAFYNAKFACETNGDITCNNFGCKTATGSCNNADPTVNWADNLPCGSNSVCQAGVCTAI